MSRIDRIQRAVSMSRASSTANDPAEEAGVVGASNLPVPVGPVLPSRSFRSEPRRGYAELTAQLIGQDGQRRGLRAGAQLIDIAHDAYNRTEWSGAADRRARNGRAAREDV